MSIFTPTQNINPWTWWLKQSDNMNGLINIVTYKTNNPDTEHKIINEVAGYGMQLDTIENVLTILIDKLPKDTLTAHQNNDIDVFNQMMQDIKAKKESLILEQLSSGGINKLIDNLNLLKAEYPEKYHAIAKRLKAEL